MNKEPLNCPFCGGKAYKLPLGEDDSNIAANTWCLGDVNCPLRDISIPIHKWNTRTASRTDKKESQQPETKECNNCIEQFKDTAEHLNAILDNFGIQSDESRKIQLSELSRIIYKRITTAQAQ